MADSMEPYKMLRADPCCRGNEIWSRRGDPVVLASEELGKGLRTTCPLPVQLALQCV